MTTRDGKGQRIQEPRRTASPAWAIAVKELRDILRERTILAAFFVQFLVAAFSTILVLGLSVLWAPGAITVESDAAVAYVGPGGFDEAMAEDGLRVLRRGPEDAARLLETGRVVAIAEETLLADPDAGPPVRHVTIHVTEGSLAAVATVPALREALQDYEQHLRDERQEALGTQVLAVPEAPTGAVPSGFIVGVLLPMLILIPAFLSGAIAGDSWVRERQTGTMALLRSGPVAARHVMAGKMLIPLVLAPLQSAAWLTVLGFSGTRVENILLLLLLSAVLSTYLAGVGIAVASAAHSTVTSQTSYAVLVLASVAASLFLPRDPLNLAALIATDNVLPDVGATLALLAVAAGVAVTAGLALAARSLRRGM